MIDREPFRPTPSSASIAAARLIAPVIVRAGRPPPPPPPPAPIARTTLPAFSLDTDLRLAPSDEDEPSTEELEAAASLLGTDWQIDPRALLQSRGIDPSQILGEPSPSRPRMERSVPMVEAPRQVLPAIVETPPVTLPPPTVETELETFDFEGLVPPRFRFPRSGKHRIALLAAAAAGALVAALIIRSFPGEASSPAVSGEPPNMLGRSTDRPTAESSVNPRLDQPAENAAPVATPQARQEPTKLSRSAAAPAPKGSAKSSTALRSGAATLQISAVPPAKVTVDGRPIGTTPRTVRVEPGLHRVAFIGANGRRSRNVNVPSGGNVNVAVRF